MKYSEFEDIISQQRMRKYLLAYNNDSKKAMTLYRYNLKLSQEMFTLISCFEVALRNKIDKQLTANLGNDWLRDAVIPNGRLYYDLRVEKTRKIIEKAYNELMRSNAYSHSKLLSEMELLVVLSEEAITTSWFNRAFFSINQCFDGAKVVFLSRKVKILWKIFQIDCTIFQICAHSKHLTRKSP